MLRLLALSSALLVTGVAAAQPRIVVLWPPQGSEHLRETAGAQAQTAVREGLAEEGYEVRVLPSDACIDPPCITEQFAEENVVFAAFVSVWASATDDAAQQVQVVLRTPRNTTYEHESLVNDGIGAAARQALAAALSNSAGARRVALRVTSEPEGAALSVNGNPGGTTPTTLDLSVGMHTVTASLMGYHPASRRLELTADRSLHFELRPENPTDDTSTTVSNEEVSPLNYVLGGGLVLAGSALLVPSLMTLARDGDCRSGCDRAAEASLYDFGGRSIAMLSLGGALVIGGSVLLILRPLRVSVSAGPDSAAVQVQGRF